MRVLLDMNLSPLWAITLTKAQIETQHWAVLGPANALDTVIIDYAKRHNYVVLTHDLDFGNMLATTNGHKPSVVQLRTEELDPGIIGPQVIRLFQQFQTELEEGALITFNPRRTRVRILPLR